MILVLGVCSKTLAQGEPVEVNGDTVEYVTEGNVVKIQGHVVIKSKQATLMCDEAEFSRDTKTAKAKGNIRLINAQGEIRADELVFNFEAQTGEFNNAKIIMAPYYGAGREIIKVDENKIVVKDGYVTTSDFDKPEYRIHSNRIEVYPKDKLIARSTKLMFGQVPLIYIPKFTQSLKDNKPRVLFTPGYNKRWGTFVLSNWRYYLTENVKGTIHLDYRERKDFASGFDLNYKTPSFGDGIIKTYYMNERTIGADHLWQERLTPTIERERFKGEWRHKWDIDPTTNTIWQYYKLSDNTFLKDYFESEHDREPNPSTYFLMTKLFPSGTLSFRTDVRVNRFEDHLDRLPEIRYDHINQEIADTGLYFQNISTYSNLTKRSASPSEVRPETQRVDTDNKVSYPMKVGFIEFTPFVGGRNTYYSRTLDPDKYNSIRGILKTGASLSTKFYRVYETEFDKYGLEIHRLRHIITPSISYEYNSRPTLLSAEIDSFDSVDSLDKVHSLTFGLDNKWQTKRNDKSVDLARINLSADYRLKDHPTTGGFDTIRSEIDLKPVDWMTLYFDSTYDSRLEHLSTANFDVYVNGGEKWTLGVGKRYSHEVDDQLTTHLAYKINHKWIFKLYERFDLDSGTLKEQEFSLTRDLHAWEMDINFNETRGEGSEIWLVFRLKAFPDMAIDMGSSFNKRKGPQ
jgi:lipopolysaccharide assembly outer membrane protein LptD (OstA)